MKKNAMLIALMEEYRKSAVPYKHILTSVPLSLFTKITDFNTNDEDCKSIQSITSHIVQSGYTYSNYINTFNDRAWFAYDKTILTPDIAIIEIDKMLDYAEQSFDGLWDKTDKTLESYQFTARWNVQYNIEQIMEHAIVHILRHRRQIENVIKQHG